MREVTSNVDGAGIGNIKTASVHGAGISITVTKHQSDHDMQSLTSQLLTRADLENLTGYVRPAEMRRWLRDNGIPFRSRPDGLPSLTWDVFNRALLAEVREGRPTRPNLSALKKAV